MLVQLDMFEPYDERKEIIKKLDELEIAQHKTRRGLFARQGKILKMLIDMKESMDVMKMKMDYIEKQLGDNDE